MTVAPLEIRVGLSGALQPLLDDESALAPLIATAVADLLARLGLSGGVEVRLEPASAGRPLRLRAAGRDVPVPPSTLRQAWLAAAPRALRHHGTAADEEHGGGYPAAWLEHAVGVGPERSTVHAVVVETVRGAIFQRPTSLLPVEAAGEPDEMQAAVQELVSRGISVSDRGAIQAQLEARAVVDQPPDETIEQLAARLRAGAVAIEIAPADAAAYGLDPAVERQAVDPSPGSVEAEVLAVLSARVHAAVGVQLPPLEWRIDSSLQPGLFSVRVNSLSILPRPALGPDDVIVLTSPDELDSLAIPHDSAEQYELGSGYRLVDAAHRDRLIDAGLFVIDGRIHTLISTSGVIRELAHRLLDIEEVEAQLGVVGASAPVLVKQVLSRMSTAQVTAMLRGLVAERLPITNLPRILERILEFATVPADPAKTLVIDDRLPEPSDVLVSETADRQRLVEFVRRGLAGEITFWYANLAHDEVLHLLPVEPDVEIAACAIVDPCADGAPEQIRDAVRAASRGLDLDEAVLVTSRGGRAALHRVLGPEMPNIRIMDHSELDRGVAVSIVDEHAVTVPPTADVGTG